MLLLKNLEELSEATHTIMLNKYWYSCFLVFPNTMIKWERLKGLSTSAATRRQRKARLINLWIYNREKLKVVNLSK